MKANYGREKPEEVFNGEWLKDEDGFYHLEFSPNEFLSSLKERPS